jgi:hypothetical protein
MYLSWSDHIEDPFNSDATPMGIVNSDPVTRVKLGPSHRQFLQTARPGTQTTSVLLAPLRKRLIHSQRRGQHCGTAGRRRRRASTSNSTSAPAPSTSLAAEVACDGVTVNSICPGPVAAKSSAGGPGTSSANCRSDARASRRISPPMRGLLCRCNRGPQRR